MEVVYNKYKMDPKEEINCDDMLELEADNIENNRYSDQFAIPNADISNISPVGINAIHDDDYLMSSDISYQNMSSSRANPGISGRRKKDFTFILEKFLTNNSRHPKKEYFNAFIIRAIKKAFRCVIKGVIPGQTAIAVDPANSNEMTQ